jgi:hypothetical protein
MDLFKNLIRKQIDNMLQTVSSTSEWQQKGKHCKWVEELDVWLPRYPLFNWSQILAWVAISVAKTAHTRYGEWHSSLPKQPFSGIDEDGEGGLTEGAGRTNKDKSASTNRSQPASKQANLG